MTENQQKTNKVKEFFANISWKIKQGNRAVNNFIERVFPFLTRWPQWLKAIFYLAPGMILLLVFTFYPIINSFIVSFYVGYGFDAVEGSWMYDSMTLIDNYAFVLAASDFGQAVLNTTYIALITVPLSVIIALLIAVSMTSIKTLKGVYQSVFFLPYVTNSIALGLVFAFMFKNNGNELKLYFDWVQAGSPVGAEPQMSFGLINQILVWLGAKPVVWLGGGAENIMGATYISALTVLLIYTIWNGLAFKIIVFMSGIEGIDKQYYQAAQVDGATKLKTFSRITVPMISPMIFYIVVTSMIGAFKTYSSVVAIIGVDGIITIGAEPINLKTIVFYIYEFLEFATVPGSLSYASAAAIILFGIILVFTLIQFWVGSKRVHY